MIGQKQNFDKESEVYFEMLKKGAAKTGFSVDYVQEYKVLDLKFEAQKYLETNLNLKILDFVCVICLSIPYLRKHFPNADLFGCDYSKKSVEKCIYQNINIKNLQVKSSNGLEVPFCENFDIIFSANVIRHIPRKNQKIIFEKLKSSLKKNGLIMMYEFNPFNPVSLYFYYAEDRKYDSENVKIMTPFRARSLFESAGFDNIKINYRFFVPDCFKTLLKVEKYLKKIPFGANYYVCARTNDKI